MKFTPTHITLENGKTVEIREATIKDAEQLIIAAKCYMRTSDYLLLYDEEFNPTKKDEINWIKSHDNINSLLIIATHNKEIIATLNVSYIFNKKISHIGTMGISILEVWRNLGLGGILLKQMIGWAKSKSRLEIITLEVFSENKHAIHLYEQFGFVKDGEKKNYFKDKTGKYYNNTFMSLYLK